MFLFCFDYNIIFALYLFFFLLRMLVLMKTQHFYFRDSVVILFFMICVRVCVRMLPAKAVNKGS